MGVNCKVCHEETQDDGYGEPIHAESGLYGVYDHRGNLTHVAV